MKGIESTSQAQRPIAGDPTGDSVAAFCNVLAGTPLLDSDRVDALAAELSREASASATPTGVGRLGRQRDPLLTPRWRRRTVLGTLLSSLALKIALAATALAATTGGLAATGNLPEPAQQVVSDLAARIGIQVPAPSSSSPASAPRGGDSGLLFGEENGDLEVQDQVPRPDSPQLPEEVAETARTVVEAVFEGDPVVDGLEFGRRVAEAASGGRAVDPPAVSPPSVPPSVDPPDRPDPPGDLPPEAGNGNGAPSPEAP